MYFSRLFSSYGRLLTFKLSPCSECCTLSCGWLPGVWISSADVSEHSVFSLFIKQWLFHTYLPMNRGSTVVKVPCCFDPSWCQWNFHWHKMQRDVWRSNAARRNDLCIFLVYLAAMVVFSISNFLRVLNVARFLVGDSLASEFHLPTFRNILSFPSS